MVNNISNDIVRKLKEDIDEADKVLVGIGFEWQSEIASDEKYINGLYESVTLADLISRKDIHINSDEEKKLVDMYRRLKQIIENKDYFIISLCYDDLIYESFSDDDNVVTPCGGYRFLQCSEHVMSRDEVEIIKGKPRCPLCNKTLSYNNIMSEEYMEESYLTKFDEYKGWLQSTINKKLVILELGTDMKFPQVIRFAFDRLVKFNLKSKLYRVNREVCMVDSSAEGRGIAVKCDSLELIKKM